jgi:hypothetical protein
VGRARTVLGFGNPFDTSHAARRGVKIPYDFVRRGAVDVCPGPKAKGPRSRVSTAFQLPDLGFMGKFAGANRKCFHPNPIGGVLWNPLILLVLIAFCRYKAGSLRASLKLRV